MKTFAQVAEWCESAEKEFGDPSKPIGMLFFRWQENLESYRGGDLTCGMIAGELVLLLGPSFRPLPFPVVLGQHEMDEQGEQLKAYGSDSITLGVWEIHPSLYLEGELHGFVVLHGVPNPPPWGRRILLP